DVLLAFSWYRAHRDLHSFPTRRSSDLLFLCGAAMAYYAALPVSLKFFQGFLTESLQSMLTVGPYISFVVRLLIGFGLVFELPVRSEEHTSELESRENLVCRLLLEKKNK